MTEPTTYSAKVRPFRRAARRLLNPLPRLTLLQMEEYRLGTDEPPLVDFSPFEGLTIPAESQPIGADSERAGSDRPHPMMTPTPETKPAAPAANRPAGERAYPVLSMRKSAPPNAKAPEPTDRSIGASPSQPSRPTAKEPGVAQQINLFVEELLAAERASVQSPADAAAEPRRKPGELYPSSLSTAPTNKADGPRTISPPIAGRPIYATESGTSGEAIFGKPSSLIGAAPFRALGDEPSNRPARPVEKTVDLIDRLADRVLQTNSAGSPAGGRADIEGMRPPDEPHRFPEVTRNGGGSRKPFADLAQPGGGTARSVWPGSARAADPFIYNAPSQSAIRGPGKQELSTLLDTPEQIVEIVAEALAEQARRHGVDLA